MKMAQKAVTVSAWNLIVLGSLFLVGCGPSIERHPISGNVTYDGKPVEYGTIFFAPDTSKGAAGPQGMAEIRQGRYQTEAEKGPVSGPHVVKITGWNASPEAGMLGAPTFTDYTTNVDITNATQLDFDVPTKGK